MKAKITIAAVFLCIIYQGLFAQPLVYNSENTGASCAPPPLPAFSALPRIEPLPDPFLWADPTRPRSTLFSDWECHRNEFRAQIENYEIGIKPLKPDSITASYAPSSATAGVLTVVVKRNGQTLTLTSQVSLPAVAGPWPAIIGMNSASGSVPATVFTSRNIARITYNHNNVTTYGGPSLNDPFYRLYPEYNLVNAGQYSAWAWGVSRIIDGLELVQASLPINLQRIGVTGCSYAGKMALYSGAFDERIALTIAQESGGGGAPSWRASHNLEPNGTVEKIDNTDYRWFKDSMTQFSGDNVYKLPHDHHELMAMVAPRALLVTGNTDFTWLSNQANYVTARAAKSIYNTLGISDRFGFYIDGGHGHCAVPNSQVPAMQAFVDKFLAGLPNINTDTIMVNPYPTVNYLRWYQWWGTGNAVLPPPPGRNIWLEAECATIGSSWNTLSDTSASNGRYVSVKSGLSSTATPPAGNDGYVVMPLTVDSAASYNFVSRLYAPVGEDYSYWMKIDNGAYQTISSLLLANGGFESGLLGWTILNSNGANITANTVASEVRTGTGALKVVNPTAQPGNQWRVQLSSAAFPTVIGKQYVVSYWVKAASPGGSIRLSSGPTSAQYQGDQTIGTSWQQVSWTITASLSSTTFLFDMGQVANTYYIDDASVKEANTGGGGSWQWIQLGSANLSVGAHTLTFGYRDGNARLDKVLISTFSNAINDKGGTATNCLTVCNTALGNRLYVDTSATGSGNGATWGCAFKQLADAVKYANTNPSITEIWVSRGVYTNGADRNATMLLSRANLQILGGFSGTETLASQANPTLNPTIISGDIGTIGNNSDNTHLLLFISSVPANTNRLVIDGFTFADANGSDGAAIQASYNSSATPVTIRRSLFRNNTASNSGGAISLDNSPFYFDSCRFVGNRAAYGGAVRSFQSTLLAFYNCVFASNTATVYGGAYYGNYGLTRIIHCALNGNTALYGGAIYQSRIDVEYYNSVISNNTAVESGGGIHQHDRSNSLHINSTFYQNVARLGGGFTLGFDNCHTSVFNGIFYKNTANGASNVAYADIYNSAGTVNSVHTSLLQTGSLVPANNGNNYNNNIRGGVDPRFLNEASPAGGDAIWFTADDGLQLSSTSTLRNIGRNDLSAGPTDISSNPRIACSQVDLGAYEFQDCPPVSGIVKAEESEIAGAVANPFTSDLQVRYAGSEKASIRVTSVAGNAMATTSTAPKGTTHINAANWAPGIYQVEVLTNSGKKINFKVVRL